MDDLVKRSDAVHAIHERIKQIGKDKDPYVLSIRQSVREIPAVDAVEVRHGRWIQKEDKDWAGGGKTLCSKCKYGYSWKMYFEPESFKYCPNCGARMDGSREDGET